MIESCPSPLALSLSSSASIINGCEAFPGTQTRAKKSNQKPAFTRPCNTVKSSPPRRALFLFALTAPSAAANTISYLHDILLPHWLGEKADFGKLLILQLAKIDRPRKAHCLPRHARNSTAPNPYRDVMAQFVSAALHGSTFARQTASFFHEYILRVLQLEEMQSSSCKLVSGFQQALEELRSSPANESSKFLDDLLKSIPSARVTRYQEAGCRHVCTEQQAVVKLNACIMGLQEHVQKAQSIVKHLEELVEKVVRLMDADLDSAMKSKRVTDEAVANDNTAADEQQEPQCEESPLVSNRKISDYALIMSSILTMLEKDVQMQELVVLDLSLHVDSECLQTYCQMWSLRPFVDEVLIREAMSWAGKS